MEKRLRKAKQKCARIKPLEQPQLVYGRERFTGNLNCHAHTRSINTTTTSRSRVAYFLYVTRGMEIWSNEKTKIFKEFVESCYETKVNFSCVLAEQPSKVRNKKRLKIKVSDDFSQS